MKNEYVKPEIQIELFMANSYVAACGQTVDGDYLFACDGKRGVIYIDSNGVSGLQKERQLKGTCGHTRNRDHTNSCYVEADHYLGGVKPCNATHKTSNLNDFVEGYYEDGTKCFIFLEYGGNFFDNAGSFNNKYLSDYHASTSLTRDQLTIVKS